MTLGCCIRYSPLCLGLLSDIIHDSSIFHHIIDMMLWLFCQVLPMMLSCLSNIANDALVFIGHGSWCLIVDQILPLIVWLYLADIVNDAWLFMRSCPWCSVDFVRYCPWFSVALSYDALDDLCVVIECPWCSGILVTMSCPCCNLCLSHHAQDDFLICQIMPIKTSWFII